MNVTTRAADGVLFIGIDRPDKKNALTSAMYAAMADALRAGEADSSVRCALIHGSDTAFTAGNDLADFLNDPPKDENAPVHRFLRAIAEFAKPLVAAVCGPAVGVGTTMLLHCDLVYAGDNAKLSLPFASLGLCPEAASSLLLPALVGHQRAAEKLMLGEPFGADEACAIGLVNRVLPAGEALAFAEAQARKLAAKPMSSLVETKRLMKKQAAALVPAVMREEGASFGRMLREPAAREAFSAFLEKRAPDFSKF